MAQYGLDLKLTPGAFHVSMINRVMCVQPAGAIGDGLMVNLIHLTSGLMMILMMVHHAGRCLNK